MIQRLPTKETQLRHNHVGILPHPDVICKKNVFVKNHCLDPSRPLEPKISTQARKNLQTDLRAAEGLLHQKCFDLLLVLS